jgi:hypothetical protein
MTTTPALAYAICFLAAVGVYLVVPIVWREIRALGEKT